MWRKFNQFGEFHESNWWNNVFIFKYTRTGAYIYATNSGFEERRKKNALK